ncbi:hypothetical protein DVH24_021652 [Malus domestica]|uniref:Uncharacterized protein n=1 Tax=Malus domestica TaxID=3750 RepID=A0A498JWT8_MALDO|nr:hypothetical protein DVH24_021652 [Malus domestica]
MFPNNFEWSRSKRSFYDPLAHLTLHLDADGDTATVAHLSLCSDHTARHLQLYCDSKLDATDIAHNRHQHDRSKPIKVNIHSIKEKLEDHIVRFPFAKSED